MEVEVEEEEAGRQAMSRSELRATRPAAADRRSSRGARLGLESDPSEAERELGGGTVQAAERPLDRLGVANRGVGGCA